MQTFATVVSFIISLYSFLIIIRIVLSWGQMGELRFSQFYRTLTKITDPYLYLFRGFPGLQRGNFDYSPLAALVVLNILSSIFTIYAQQGIISLGIILAVIVQSIWSVLAFFLFLFIVLVIIDLVMVYSQSQTQSPNRSAFQPILENLIRGPVSMSHNLLFRGREVSEMKELLGTLLLLFVFRFAGNILINWLISLLYSMPI